MSRRKCPQVEIIELKEEVVQLKKALKMKDEQRHTLHAYEDDLDKYGCSDNTDRVLRMAIKHINFLEEENLKLKGDIRTLYESLCMPEHK
jgi:hypothetical protein